MCFFKVADFGLSQWRTYQTTVSNSKFKASGDVSGTLTHIPPESLYHAELSPQRDVYAFGITLWELLTEEIPFKGEDYNTFNMHCNMCLMYR